MRIVVHDYAGHPNEVYMSRELARRGHDVLHLYAGSIETPRGELVKTARDAPTFEVEGVFHTKPFLKHTYVRRQLQEIEYGRLLVKRIESSNRTSCFLETRRCFPRRGSFAIAIDGARPLYSGSRTCMAWRWTRRFVESFPSQATWWAATTSVWKRSFFCVATRLWSSPRVFCQPSKAGACQRTTLRLYRCGRRWTICPSFPKRTSGRDNMDATERSI